MIGTTRFYFQFVHQNRSMYATKSVSQLMFTIECFIEIDLSSAVMAKEINQIISLKPQSL